VADVVLLAVSRLSDTGIPSVNWNGDITLKLKKYGYKDYNFKDNETVEWRDELDQRKIATFPKGGSIATSEAILQEVLSNKPKISTKTCAMKLKTI
jgi:hypothetical protein